MPPAAKSDTVAERALAVAEGAAREADEASDNVAVLVERVKGLTDAIGAHEARDAERHVDVVGRLTSMQAEGVARGKDATFRERMMLGLVVLLVLAVVGLAGQGVKASAFGASVELNQPPAPPASASVDP